MLKKHSLPLFKRLSFKKALYFAFAGALAMLLCAPEEADARKRRRRRVLRKWQVSFTNGYTFYSHKDKVRTSEAPLTAGELFDGQMNQFFSSLEVARNFGQYEVGGRLQLRGKPFVSPYIKLNLIKNRRRRAIIPFLALGAAPAELTGVYARAGMSLFFNNRFALSPFLGSYFWFRAKEDISYVKHSFYGHGGASISLYF